MGREGQAGKEGEMGWILLRSFVWTMFFLFLVSWGRSGTEAHTVGHSSAVLGSWPGRSGKGNEIKGTQPGRK